MISIINTGYMVIIFLFISIFYFCFQINNTNQNTFYGYTKNGFVWTLLAIILIFSFLWFFPKWQVSKNGPGLTAKDLISAENDTRRTWSQALGYFGGIILLFFAWKRIEVSQEGQITDRFTRSIEHLGSDDTEVRMGGIYALERIAKDSEKDHLVIVEILTAYIRERAAKNIAESGAPNTKDTTDNEQICKNCKEEKFKTSFQPANHTSIQPSISEGEAQTDSYRRCMDEAQTDESASPPEDIQAALSVIGRRKVFYENNSAFSLNLSRTDLAGANLQNGNFTDVNLEESNLQNSILINSKLDGANLMWSNLNEAILRKASMQKASLVLANLQEAELREADLREAELMESNLRAADLRGAMLQNANLSACDLSQADLRGANLKGAKLEGAILDETVRG